jgi:hypothetical protein
LTSEVEKKDEEKKTLDDKIKDLSVKYHTMVSNNSRIIANLENK